MVPLLSGAGGGIAVALEGQRLEQRHNLAITVRGLDDAKVRYFPDEPPSDPPRQLPFPAGPETRFTYLTTLWNSGEFSEEQVSFALDFRVVGFQEVPQPEAA